jgi:hypothetical protein
MESIHTSFQLKELLLNKILGDLFKDLVVSHNLHIAENKGSI